MNRAEVLAEVLAEHNDTEGGLSPRSQRMLVATLDAALAAQEGERGGAEVAAAVEAVLPTGRLMSTDRYRAGQHDLAARVRAALADPAGALATHDAEVLRAAAEDYARSWPERSGRPHADRWLRERADCIEAQQG